MNNDEMTQRMNIESDINRKHRTPAETIDKMYREAQMSVFQTEDQLRMTLDVFMKGASLGVIARGEVKAQLDELIHQRIRLASFRGVLTKI